jgi:hypothetical protein
MPSADTLERFIARVESGAHAEAIAEFYVENGAIPRTKLLRVSAGPAWSSTSKVFSSGPGRSSRCAFAPFSSTAPLRVIRWIFRFQWLDGTSTEMEELAYQRWQGEQIVEEQFFYDPAQLRPKSTAL